MGLYLIINTTTSLFHLGSEIRPWLKNHGELALANDLLLRCIHRLAMGQY